MTEISPDGFGWRKYECPVPVFRFSAGDPDPSVNSYLVWAAESERKFPHLPRWDGLEKAFVGFVSRGFGPPVAVAYSLEKVFACLRDGGLLSRTWIPAADAAEFAEFVKYNLLGVWMGERTPFFISVSDSWDDIIRLNLGGFV